MLEQTIETLSKGFRRRVGLAQAIVHDPPVLILDEPTDGLDPNQKHEVRTLINEMARDKIIVISTHILEEVDAVCTRAIIIARGRIVADDTPAGLAARSRYHNAVSMQLEAAGAAGGGARRAERAADGGRRRGERARCAPDGAAALGQHDPAGGLGAGRAAGHPACRICTWNRDASTRCSARLPLEETNAPCATWASSCAASLRVISRRRSRTSSSSSSWCWRSLFTFYLGGFYERGQADLDPFFTFQPWLYLFLIPAISMRLWAEERKSGSIELLMTQPVTLWQAVLGKFLAAWLFTALALALTFPLWITVNYLGNPDNGAILAAYLGSLLLAGGFLAIGSCMSALTRNQVIAFILAVVACFAFLLAGFPMVLDLFRAWAPQVLVDAVASLSFLTHFESIAKGVIDLRDLLYFAMLIGFFLLATAIALELRKAD